MAAIEVKRVAISTIAEVKSILCRELNMPLDSELIINIETFDDGEVEPKTITLIHTSKYDQEIIKPF
jgi:hypothetical protein